MQLADLIDIVEWVEDRYPARPYKDPDRVFNDFAHLPAVAVQEAAVNHYKHGSPHPPTYAELRAEGSRIAASRHQNFDQSGCTVRGSHGPWAVDTHSTSAGMIAPGFEEGTCLGCGVTKLTPANQLRDRAASWARQETTT